MTNFETLCESITAYERKQLADDWTINFYSTWENVTFAEIVSDIEKYGIGKNPYSLMNELAQRISNYHTFANDCDKPDRERLHETSDALKVMDERFNLGLHDWVFNGKTADEIADEWEEQERWEKEEEARQECIDFCANVAFNDGLCESLEEAYDLASMVC